MVTTMQRKPGPRPETQEDYQRIIIRIANGEKIDEAEASAILAGRETAHIENDISTLQQRRAAVEFLTVQAPQLQKELAAMESQVAAAKKAFDELPIVKMLNEMELAKQEIARLQGSAREMAWDLNPGIGRARHLLQSTASREINQELAHLWNAGNAPRFDREKLQLSESEQEAFDQAQADIDRLPALIKKADATDAAVMTAKLLGQRRLVIDFQERLEKVKEIDKVLAALDAQREELTGKTALCPEAMEFTSKPRSREL